MNTPARTASFVLLGALPLLLVMELCARVLLLYPGPIRARLDDLERLNAQRWFGDPPPGDLTSVEIAGSSLSFGVAPALDATLQQELGDDYHAYERSGGGAHLGDALAEVLENAAPGHLTMLEINLWTFNERRYRYAPASDEVVARLWYHQLPLAEHAGYGLRRALVRQSGLEDLLAGWLLRRVASYYLSHCFKGGIRTVVREKVLGARPRREPPEEWERETTRKNIRRKNLESGPDTPTLELLFDWVDAHPEQLDSLIVFFPPLNSRYIREVLGDEAAKWDEITAWRDQLARRLEARGVTVFDYTDLLRHTPELFRDYGHVEREAYPLIAEAMLRDLLAKGLLRPRPPGASPASAPSPGR